MRNAQTYWGLTRKIGPYRPTKYDDELAHSRQPAFGHMREVEFRPAPYIPTKPFPGMWNYDTLDVVSKPVFAVPAKASAVPLFNRKPNPQDVTGRKRLRDTRRGVQPEDDVGMQYDVQLGQHGEKTYQYEDVPEEVRGSHLGRRTGFHYNDTPGTVNEENARGRAIRTARGRAAQYRQYQRQIELDAELEGIYERRTRRRVNPPHDEPPVINPQRQVAPQPMRPTMNATRTAARTRQAAQEMQPERPRARLPEERPRQNILVPRRRGQRIKTVLDNLRHGRVHDPRPRIPVPPPRPPPMAPRRPPPPTDHNRRITSLEREAHRIRTAAARGPLLPAVNLRTAPTRSRSSAQ